MLLSGMAVEPEGRASKHAAVERKYIWKQMLPMLDPFTIAAASVLSHRVRAWCVSKSGLLNVPYLLLNYADALSVDRRMMHALPAIDRTELVEFELWNHGCEDVWGNDSTTLDETEPTSDCRFSMCLGWFFGVFPKLRRVAIFGLRKRLELVPLLRSLRRCPALEELSLQEADFNDFKDFEDHICPAFDVVQALPAFTDLRILHLAVRPAMTAQEHEF